MAENESSDGDGSEDDIVDVDFDFFDPQPIDFHAVKNLLANLFEDDVVDLSALTDFLVQQKSVGTCVKVDGSSDPYSFLSVLNLHAHKATPFVREIREYLLSRCKGEPRARLARLLDDATKHVGFVFNERLLNMPVHLSPPTFELLSQELQLASDDGRPFRFAYLLFLMKTYRETRAPDADAAAQDGGGDDDDDGEDGSGAGRARKSRKVAASSSAGTAGTPASTLYFFNEEEEFIVKDAVLEADFRLPKGRAAARFLSNGIQPYRKIVVVEAVKLPAIVQRMKSEISLDDVRPSSERS